MGSHTHHSHDWPLRASDWEELVECRRCGLELLDQFINIADWVVRRVEGIRFLDDRTVRRRVSVDYTVPEGGVVMRIDGRDARILPLAMLRRQSLIKFDFRTHDGRPAPLLGLRENQALTRSVIHAWAGALLEETGWDEPRLPEPLVTQLERVVAGNQSQLTEAYQQIQDAAHGHRRLKGVLFTTVLDRLAGNFVLFGIEHAPPGSRRIVKWSYEEALTLLHSTTAYQGHANGPCPPVPDRDGHVHPVSYGLATRKQHRYEADPVLSGLGIQPTLIRFPTPGAELAASFHVEITAPPEVSIVRASLLAGLPNLRFNDRNPQADRDRWNEWHDQHDKSGGARRDRLHRSPSFDSVGGGDATVDLHVAEVPYGSLSRVQVELQASPSGWLATAWLGALLGTLMLLVGWLGRQPDKPDLPALLFITYAVGMVAIVVRPDPHAMATRLLSTLRMLAGFTVILTLAAALVYTFVGVDRVHWYLFGFTVASLVPTATLTIVWWLARRRLIRSVPGERRWRRHWRRLWEPWWRRLRGEPKERHRVSPTSWHAAARRLIEEYRHKDQPVRLSPWDQHLPTLASAMDPWVDPQFRTDLAGRLEQADYPYDEAVERLGFDRSGIKVASVESDRFDFRWNAKFNERLRRRLDQALRDHVNAARR
jgi:hypothetical protein